MEMMLCFHDDNGYANTEGQISITGDTKTSEISYDFYKLFETTWGVYN